MSEELLKIGSYTPATGNSEAVINREWYHQGFIVKDEEAFLNHLDKVCYVPELHDTAYTRQEFLDLCNGQEELAAECFYALDWQSPETWVDELFATFEWAICPDCNLIYEMAGEPCPCPKCGKLPDQLIKE